MQCACREVILWDGSGMDQQGQAQMKGIPTCILCEILLSSEQLSNCSLLVLSTQLGLIKVPLDGIKEALAHDT